MDGCPAGFRAGCAAGFFPAEAAAVPERTPQAIERLRVEWTLPAPPPAAVAAPPAPAQDAQAPVSFRWVGDTLRHVGTVVHQMLRRIATGAGTGWDTARVRQAQAGIRAALVALGVPAADVPDAVETVIAALVDALEDPRGLWVLRGGDEAACEFPLSGMVSGEIVHARVDRTFIDAEGVRWIVDYKTSSHEGAGVEAFLDAECDRYRAQLERYRRLFAALEDRPVRTALYFPLLGGWREVAAEAAQLSTAYRED